MSRQAVLSVRRRPPSRRVGGFASFSVQLQAEDGIGPLRAAVRGARFVLVSSQFNEPITRALVRGALGILRRAGVPAGRTRTVWVPGAFELPAAAARLARLDPQPQAIIALGAIIRGETPQYEAIAGAVAQGLSCVSVNSGIPVTLGVVVADSLQQAQARAGGAMGNRGAEAALAALEMVCVFRRLVARSS